MECCSSCDNRVKLSTRSTIKPALSYRFPKYHPSMMARGGVSSPSLSTFARNGGDSILRKGYITIDDSGEAPV